MTTLREGSQPVCLPRPFRDPTPGFLKQRITQPTTCSSGNGRRRELAADPTESRSVGQSGQLPSWLISVLTSVSCRNFANSFTLSQGPVGF